MGPRPIPKRYGKRQNFKATAWRSVWLCPKVSDCFQFQWISFCFLVQNMNINQTFNFKCKTINGIEKISRANIIYNLNMKEKN